MTEQSALPHRSNTNPKKPILYEVLVISALLVAVIVVYTRIFRQGLIPTSILSATLTETGTPSTEIPVSETPLNGVSSIETTLTFTPVAETPIFTEPPASTTPSSPSLTPAFGSCQYTLKSGPDDYLYAIYWNWHIDKNIPDLNNYYARIYCAALLSNIKCDYQAADPDITQPGWILILPGVSSNICLYHGGTPAP
jgi:hypothetical protein